MIWIAAFAVGIALLLLLGKTLFPADRSNAAKLMNTYRRLTEEQLAAVPDTDVVTAVVSNLLAKCEDQRCEPYALIPTLSRQRSAVYSIWALQKELACGEASHLRRSEQFGFSELAADALEWLECADAAKALRDYLQTADTAQIDALKEALTACAVDEKLIALIRNEPAMFCDA